MFLFASISAGNFTNTVVFGKTNETFENTENTTEIINIEPPRRVDDEDSQTKKIIVFFWKIFTAP